MIRVVILLVSISAAFGQPTFTRDIAPIVFQNCSSCHRPGESAPFPLLTYQNCAKRAQQLAELTANRTMPPWLPDPAYQHYEGERLLSEPQISLFAAWAAAGAPEGDPAHLSTAPAVSSAGWTLGKPDLVIQTPVYQVPAEGRDVYRNFVVSVPLSTTQYVAGFEFDPGNRRVAHHAFVLFDRTHGSRALDEKDPLPGFDGMDMPRTAQSPDGHFLSWQPGKRYARNPAGMSWNLYPKSDLVLQLHLQPSGKPESLQGSFAFYFTNQPPTRYPQKIVLTSYNIDIPAGVTAYEVTNSFRMPVDADILSVLPHAHYLGKDLRGYIVRPDGKTNWLIRIPNWNFNWQGDYRLKDPVFAPAGSTLVMRFSYDNSTNNPHNPAHPPVRVRYGVQTKDEMAELWVQALPRKPAELPILREAVERQTIDFAIDFARYRLQLNPNDAKAHLKYAQALLGKGRRREAVPHLNAAVQADPALDDPHYYLGLIARMDNKPAAAAQHFGEAIRLNPQNFKAYGNLGLILLEQDKSAEAEKNFLRAVELEPTDAISHDSLAIIYARAGQLGRAEAHLRQAAAAAPEDTEIQAHLAAVAAANKPKRQEATSTGGQR